MGHITQQTGQSPRSVRLCELKAKHPLPHIAAGTVDPALMCSHEATRQARALLDNFNAAVAADDEKALQGCFHPGQSFWRDKLALTWHLRTISGSGPIAASFLETKRLRQLVGEIRLSGAAQFNADIPQLLYVNLEISFRTESPGANCKGSMKLLPVKTKLGDGREPTEWKVWILSTDIDSLDLHAEDESLLRGPGRQLHGAQEIETDVLIIGAGNAAISLAARLKAFGIDSVCVERSARPGDNWRLRYDFLKFHVPTSFGDLPYLAYPPELRHAHLLTREELADMVQRYVAAFNLNVVHSAKIHSTRWIESAKQWDVRFSTPEGECTAVAKHLVQATGVGSRKPCIPSLAGSKLYQGISIHSTQFKNGEVLKAEGVERVIIVGSANTAFDVLQDCCAAGLKATMIVRSKTYICPIEHVNHMAALIPFDTDIEAADQMFLNANPTVVDAQICKGLFVGLSVAEPDRYTSLAEAGFPVMDGAHEDTDLIGNLLERAGGHYVDIGGTKVIETGEAGVRAHVEPVAYTAGGLILSDGSAIEADAIVWCTGFADHDVRDTAAEVLGGGEAAEALAQRLDSTWGLDDEGEVRGMWKRHRRLDNYWVVGGGAHQHRVHSRTVALQILASLGGVLPPAYRDTPGVDKGLGDD